MATVKQLFQLQELDLEIVRLQSEVSSLESRIGDRLLLNEAEAELAAAQAEQHQLQMDQTNRELEAGSVRAKLETDRQRLYGGTVSNLKELEGLEKETSSLDADLQKREEVLLEMMEALEKSQAALAEAERRTTDQAKQWQVDQKELNSQWQQLGENLEQLESLRKETAGGLAPQQLSLYESLRASKGGVAVARVERGLCRGCLMALPTHQLQKVRMSREPVRCNSCGRLLFVS